MVQQDNGQAGNFGLRSGKWKLLRHDGKKSFNLNVNEKLAFTSVPKFQLFDLANDPNEQHDIMEKEPVVARRMQEQLAAIIANGRTRKMRAEASESP